MLVRLTGLIRDLEVDTERMRQNLEATGGLVFSQAALLGLVGNGMTRDEAYRVVQLHAMEAWGGKGSLRDLLAADPHLELSDADLDAWFSLDRVRQGLEVVFERLAALEGH
jgi:adenylosuccinate lyase